MRPLALLLGLLIAGSAVADPPVIVPQDGHAGPLRALAIGPLVGLRTWAATADDTDLFVWDLSAQGQPLRTAGLALQPLFRGSAVKALALSADNELVACGTRTGQIAILRRATLVPAARLIAAGGEVLALAFGADEKSPVVVAIVPVAGKGGPPVGRVRAWRIEGETAHPLNDWRQLPDSATTLAAGKGGHDLLIGTRSGTIHIVDVKSGQCQLAAGGQHGSAVLGIQVDAESGRAYSHSANDVAVWDVPGRRFVERLPAPGDTLRAAAGPGRVITSKGTLLDVKTQPPAQVSNFPAGNRALFTADGTRALVSHATQPLACLINVADGRWVPLGQRRDRAEAAALSPSGRWAVAASEAAVCVWDLEKGRLLSSPRVLGTLAASVTDAGLLALGLKNGRVKLVALGDGPAPALPDLNAGDGKITHLAFNAPGDHLLAVAESSVGAVAHIWTVADGKVVRQVKLDQPALAAALAPDGQTFAVSGRETLSLELYRAGAAMSERLGLAIIALAFVGNNLLFCGSEPGRLYEYDLRQKAAPQLRAAVAGAAVTAMTANDRGEVVMGTADGQVALWDGQQLAQFPRPADSLQVQAVGSRGTARVVSLEKPGTLRLWERGPWRELARAMSYDDGTDWLAYTPGGYYEQPGGVRTGQPPKLCYRAFGREVIAGSEFDGANHQAGLLVAGPETLARQFHLTEPLPSLVLARRLPNVPVPGQPGRTRIALEVFSTGDEPPAILRARSAATGSPVRLTPDTEERLADGVRRIYSDDPHKEPTAYTFTSQGAARPRHATVHVPPVQPVFYVVAIGVSDNQKWPLEPVKNDLNGLLKCAAAFKGTLVRVTTVRDRDATPKNIEAALETVARQAGINDTVLLYLSGHGRADGQNYLFLGADGLDKDGGLQREHCITGDRLADLLLRTFARHVAVVLDTCHAGKFPEAFQRVRPDAPDRPQRADLAVLMACGADDKADVTPKFGNKNGQHSLLSYALLVELDDSFRDPGRDNRPGIPPELVSDWLELARLRARRLNTGVKPELYQPTKPTADFRLPKS